MTAREGLGLAVFAVDLLLLGAAVLLAAGIGRGRGDALRAAGLALVLGWATTGLVATAELLVGLRASLGELLVGQAVVAAACVAVGRRVAALPPARPHRPRSPLAVVSAAVLGLYLVGLAARSLVPLEVLNNDAWTQWLLKAKVIYFFGLDTGVGGYTSQANGNYPPLDPALESTAWHFLGSPDFVALPLFHWLVFVAFVAALAYLLAPRVSPDVLWPSLAMLALAPRLAFFVGSSLADEPLALLIGLGAALGALWLLEDEPRWLALACVFLAAATLTKNEGTVMALILAVLLAVAARRRLGLVLIATPIAAELPWKLWLRLEHGPPGFAYTWGRLLHPYQLAARADYLSYGARSLLGEVFAPSRWLLIVPAALLLGVAAALRRSPLAVVAIGFPLLTFAAFELSYWAGTEVCRWSPGYACDGTWHDVFWLVGASADRIPVSVVVVSGVLFPLLVRESGARVPRRAEAALGRANARMPRA